MLIVPQALDDVCMIPRPFFLELDVLFHVATQIQCHVASSFLLRLTSCCPYPLLCHLALALCLEMAFPELDRGNLADPVYVLAQLLHALAE